MGRILLVSLLLIISLNAFSQFPGIKVVQFDEIEILLASKSDSVYVLNFWATWCKPCIEELPAFEQLTRDYKGKKLKVFLISLDFKSKLKERVVPFVKKNGLVSDVLLLNEPDYNSWINKVDPKWSGSIPATIILNGKTGNKKFYEQSFEYPRLKMAIDSIINQ